MAQLSGEIRGGAYPSPYGNGTLSKLVKKYNPPKKKAKPKASNAYGNGTLNRLVKKYNPPKKNYGQPAQNTAKRNSPAPKKTYKAPAKKSGGAYGSGGRYYKNGYVDSKGNRVVNGRWQSPAKKATPKRSSGGGSSSTFKSPARVIPKTIQAPVEKPKPKKTAAQLKAEREAANKKYLAGDTQYQNELGGLKDALARYNEQNKADTNTLNRSYNSQVGKNGKGGSIEKNRKKSQVGNSEGFAMRGMLRSGGYSEQASEINDTYKDQTTRVTDGYNDDKNRLSRAKSAEGETVNQKREQARIAALSRKANQEILKAQASSQ